MTTPFPADRASVWLHGRLRKVVRGAPDASAGCTQPRTTGRFRFQRLRGSVLGLVVAAAAVCLSGPPALAEQPRLVTFSGTLTTAQGEPVSGVQLRVDSAGGSYAESKTAFNGAANSSGEVVVSAVVPE